MVAFVEYLLERELVVLDDAGASSSMDRLTASRDALTLVMAERVVLIAAIARRGRAPAGAEALTETVVTSAEATRRGRSK